MARIKKELKEMFDACNSYGELFTTMGEAKKRGFMDAEINTAASYRKNVLATAANEDYKRIPRKDYDVNGRGTQYLVTQFTVSNLASNKIEFNGATCIL